MILQLKWPYYVLLKVWFDGSEEILLRCVLLMSYIAIKDWISNQSSVFRVEIILCENARFIKYS